MAHDDERARDPSAGDDFAARAEAATPGLLAELVAFLRTNKKWWLTPVVVVLLLVALLAILGSSAAAPFVYTLF